ncbi:hypothetical protein [Jeotgalibacillus haloalkalitolerans]|uniref:Uncharacterized protein n=1 Tax=Jeotgalibacillus haloalkalitolerans TaxID=3104292 RepID=A0ABU5KPJ8_9BACL|nr:hypothetical protein [Jeotgalibacillus sp. HH7-29]MDZ5712635.1 hypothetical protein [Jeotgalibacillus sp. HH7-29]
MFEGVQLPVTATLIAASYIVIYLIDRLIMKGTLAVAGLLF